MTPFVEAIGSNQADAMRAIIELLEAAADKISVRSSYNIVAMSLILHPVLAAEIRRHVLGFEIVHAPDSRQLIADSWPLD